MRLVTSHRAQRCSRLGGSELRQPGHGYLELRAMVVENVMARCQEDVVCLPAGPSFRLEAEVKNVVTVLAKTWHYWTAHWSAQRREGL